MADFPLALPEKASWELQKIAIGKGEKNTMKKSTYLLALLATATSLVYAAVPLFASETDDRIELSAKESYVFSSPAVYGRNLGSAHSETTSF